jgi:glycerol dehydrogenase-like iron-containing ADH family enzyme
VKQTAIFPGRYVQVEEAIADLGEEIHRLGSEALLIVGKTAAQEILPTHLPAWRNLVEITVER